MDGATVNLTQADLGFDGKPPKITVEDLDQIVADMTTRNAPKFEDGSYACVCTPYFLKDLRRDDEFREVARYPGQVPVSMMTPPGTSMQPPQVPFSSSPYVGGLMAGQAQDLMGQSSMPTGFVFNGVRFFVSTNLPVAQVTLNYTNATNTGLNGSRVRNADIGIFFGPEAIGLGVGGPGPEILLNNNDDFQRYVIAIWRMYGSWELLDERFVTVGRSFRD